MTTTRKPIDWEFTNDEQDVEVAHVGPEWLLIVLTIWQEDSQVTLVVSRDDDITVGNTILEREFDTVDEAKAWAEWLFGSSEETA